MVEGAMPTMLANSRGAAAFATAAAQRLATPTSTDPFRSGFADLGSVRLHYVEAGEGPLVILLHGFPEYWYSWRHQIPGLAAAGYRVVAPDLRGYNQSSRPKGIAAYDSKLLAADIRDLIRKLGAGKAHLVGHDWGGGVAWQTAIDHPEVIESLTILNCGHLRRMFEGLRDPRQLWRSWYMIFFQLPWLPEAVFGLVRRWNFAFERDARPGAFTDADLRRYRKVWAQPGAVTAMLNYYRAAVRVSRSEAMSRLSRPVQARTLVIWGRRDRYIDQRLATPHAADVPNLDRVEFIDEASHWVQHDAPEKVLALLIGFFAGIADRRLPIDVVP